MSVKNHSQLPKGSDLILLSLGVIGIGTSGPLIALSIIAIPVLIFWRNLGGALLLLPFALRSKNQDLKANSRSIYLSIFAGVLLALHFLCFFTAVRFTTVAAATALTALQPIFAAFIISLCGGRIPKRSWIGMYICFAAILLITGIEWGTSFRHFQGDLIAIAAAILAAAYVILGGQAQQKIPAATYTCICYTACAITVLPLIAIFELNLIHYKFHEWFLLLAINYRSANIRSHHV